MIFNYEVSGIRGQVLPATQPVDEPIMIEIEAEKINEATEKIKEYFYKNYLIADKIKLISIRFNNN